MLGKMPEVVPESLESVLGRRPATIYSMDREDPLHCYLREVGCQPLLSFEEECALAKRIAEEDSADARNILVEKNLRLVLKISKKYLYRGLALADLIEEGNLGLIHAAGKFDPSKECRFSTYATWWIQEYIEKAIIDTGNTIRIPVHVAKAVSKLKSVYRKLTQHMDSEPTLADLSKAAQLPLEEINHLLQITRMSHLEGLYFENGEELNRVIPDTECNPLGLCGQMEIHKRVFEDFLAILPNIEREVLIRRFGLDGDTMETLEQVAASLQITREKVRLVQIRALKHLRVMMEKEGLNMGTLFDS